MDYSAVITVQPDSSIELRTRDATCDNLTREKLTQVSLWISKSTDFFRVLEKPAILIQKSDVRERDEMRELHFVGYNVFNPSVCPSVGPSVLFSSKTTSYNLTTLWRKQGHTTCM